VSARASRGCRGNRFPGSLNRVCRSGPRALFEQLYQLWKGERSCALRMSIHDGGKDVHALEADHEIRV
jgi:hypothetical protein